MGPASRQQYQLPCTRGPASCPTATPCAMTGSTRKPRLRSRRGWTGSGWTPTAARAGPDPARRRATSRQVGVAAPRDDVEPPAQPRDAQTPRAESPTQRCIVGAAETEEVDRVRQSDVATDVERTRRSRGPRGGAATREAGLSMEFPQSVRGHSDSRKGVGDAADTASSSAGRSHDQSGEAPPRAAVSSGTLRATRPPRDPRGAPRH